MSKTLRRRLSNLLSVLLVIFLVGSVVTAPRPARARVDSLADRLKCPQCDVAIADSPAQIAQDMLALVKERVEAGWSDQQIVDAFVAAYGSGVLLDPPLDGRTAALWATPAVALVVGVWLALGRRRWVGEDREHRAGADRELSGGGKQ